MVLQYHKHKVDFVMKIIVMLFLFYAGSACSDSWLDVGLGSNGEDVGFQIEGVYSDLGKVYSLRHISMRFPGSGFSDTSETSLNYGFLKKYGRARAIFTAGVSMNVVENGACCKDRGIGLPLQMGIFVGKNLGVGLELQTNLNKDDSTAAIFLSLFLGRF